MEVEVSYCWLGTARVWFTSGLRTPDALPRIGVKRKLSTGRAAGAKTFASTACELRTFFDYLVAAGIRVPCVATTCHRPSRFAQTSVKRD